VTGANFSGFKDFLPELIDLSFPIAEIEENGACTITKIKRYGGTVTKFNTIAQLLYELQGELYLNPDTVADLREIRMTSTGPDRVFVTGVKGMPPPPTTKAMIAAPGGFQAEATFYINGLDVPEKARMMQQQLKNAFRNNNFSKFSIELCGTPAADPHSQQAGTVFLRVFAQAREKKDIAADKFKIPIYAIRMQSYPGNYALVSPHTECFILNR
jgi:Acyclic terpene utilisation family protein AtuA